jgi:hypothetical protein
MGFSKRRQGIDVQVAPNRILPFRRGRVRTLYVHDDNLGSHAHYDLYDGADTIVHERSAALMLHRGRLPGSELTKLNDLDDGEHVGEHDAALQEWWTPDDWVVDTALVPKPEKLRIQRAGASETFHLRVEFAKLVEIRVNLLDIRGEALEGRSVPLTCLRGVHHQPEIASERQLLVPNQPF